MRVTGGCGRAYAHGFVRHRCARFVVGVQVMTMREEHVRLVTFVVKMKLGYAATLTWL